jgi:cell division protein FtsB
MTDPKQTPFALNRGRIVLLILGAVLVLIAISTWFGGINAYQQLRQANAEATSNAAAETETETSQ